MAEVLDKLTAQETAFKDLTNIVDGSAILSPENLGKFLRAMQLDQPILKNANYEYMKAPEKNLNRTGIVGRALTSGYEPGTEEKGRGKTRVLSQNERKSLSYGANKLVAKKLRACAKIEDDDLEDTIEREELKNTLLNLMGQKVGEDFEFWGMYADKSINHTDNMLLYNTDGWLKKAGTHLEQGTHFDVTSSRGVVNLFDRMIAKLSPRFRSRRDKLAFYVPYEVEKAYRNWLQDRNTALGDSLILGNAPLTYDKIPIYNPATLDDPEGRELTEKGHNLLTDPLNMAWGTYKNMKIAPERDEGPEMTYYWYRFRGDVNYYRTDGVIEASIDLDVLDELIDYDVNNTLDENLEDPENPENP